MDKIICVGKNYADHAAELGDVHPEKPVIFIKPPSNLQTCPKNGAELKLSLPSHSMDIHHEVELVFRIDQDGYKMSLSEAQKALGAVTVGLDMTLRDLQQEAKRKGTPWTTGKVFRDAAAIGPWLELGTDAERILEQEFTLTIDGQLKQRGKASQMSHSPAECLAYVSQFFPVCAGDILFTGTPVGVGPVKLGQRAVLNFAGINYSVSWIEQH